ncbi:MAG TPA: tetratricopeptide repeat protein, partial [Vicinamibacterales bacterium]
ARDRGDHAYALALARALERNRDDEAARSLLLTLRESSPEDVEINLELARLAAERHDVTEAARFYHNALYGPWSADRADARREVRVELVRFLLAHQQSARALSELMALTSDLPDRPDAHAQAGALFAQAGDDEHALEQFRRALRSAPNDAAALTGAGQAAFRLGQYAVARTYLRRAPRGADGDTLDVADRVLADDPLASRIGIAERRRRLASDVEYGWRRLSECAPGSADEAGLLRDAYALAKHPASDQDEIEAGVDLVTRIGHRLVDSCPPVTPRDRALVLIGRAHGIAAP